jgi:hypothetical protein
MRQLHRSDGILPVSAAEHLQVRLLPIQHVSMKIGLQISCMETDSRHEAESVILWGKRAVHPQSNLQAAVRTLHVSGASSELSSTSLSCSLPSAEGCWSRAGGAVPAESCCSGSVCTPTEA